MIARIGRKLAGRSVGEIAHLVVKNVAHAAHGLSPAAVAVRRTQGEFDRRWGTETGGLVNLTDLSVDPTRARHGVRYQASDGDILTRAVTAFDIDPGDWTFVDYGSGKGRIVLTAAFMRFAEAIGVEFSPELVRIAQTNAHRFTAAGGADRAPRFVLGDAGAFDPPAGRLLAYVYNPFGPPVLDEVVARLEAKAAGGDSVLVAYVDPRHLNRFSVDRWTAVERTPDLALLRAL